MSCKEQSTLYTEDWVLYPRADASKMRYRPTQHQLDRLDLYINSTLWGLELDSAGVPVSLQDHSSHGIRSSMFWIPLPTTNETGEPGYVRLRVISIPTGILT